jgi:hypothetical protein
MPDGFLKIINTNLCTLRRILPPIRALGVLVDKCGNTNKRESSLPRSNYKVDSVKDLSRQPL